MARCQRLEQQTKSESLLEMESGGEGMLVERQAQRCPRVVVVGIASIAAGLVAAVCLAMAAPTAPAVSPAFGSSSVVELTLIKHKDSRKEGANASKLSDDEKEADRLPLIDHTKEDKTCSWGKENCNKTQCCNNPGMQCSEQNGWYAQCRETCKPGPDPTHWDGHKWTCKALGERAEGSSTCSAQGEDCSKTQCCLEANAQCYEKAPGWAACKASCTPWAPDLGDSDSKYWTCKELGSRTPGASQWVAEQCSADGEDCRSSQCCKSPGKQCFAQGNDWASCKYDCTAGTDPERSWEPAWSCDEIGMRTPGTGPAESTVVSKWVLDECSWPGSDCKGSRCCVGMNQQCYSKNEDWAMCKQECIPGRHVEDNNETWSCNELGQRSHGLAIKGDPSLFCWSLFQPTGYEMGIIQYQLNNGLGIFQCDGQILLSTDEPTKVGTSPEGEEFETLQVPWAEITTSVDGTAGNAALFINCWNVVVENGRWNNYAWTMKVDPDAVLIPDRLRNHLSSHVLENIFVLNCNAYPSSPEFPMMYGSLEILSWKAIHSYADNMWKCMRDMAEFIPLWGEDRFMKKCLDYIGVGAIQDFDSVGDGVCSGVDCGNAWVSAFHPFKTVDGWQQCWDTAHR